MKETASLADKIAGSTGGSNGISDERTTMIETIVQILKSKTLIQQAVDSILDRELKPSVDRVLKDIIIQIFARSNGLLLM